MSTGIETGPLIGVEKGPPVDVIGRRPEAIKKHHLRGLSYRDERIKRTWGLETGVLGSPGGLSVENIGASKAYVGPAQDAPGV